MVAEARARLSLDGKPFTDTLKGLSEEAKGSFTKSMNDVGKTILQAFSVAAVLRFGQQIIQAADAADNMSKRLGVSAETVQSLDVVAKEAGLSMADFEAAILKTSKNATDAEAGNTAMAESFAKIGISLADIKSMSPEQLFEAVAKSMNENGSNAEVLSAAYEVIGGKSGPKLTSVIKELGEKGFSALNEEMLKTNQIMSNDTVKSWDNFGDQVSKLQRQLQTWASNSITYIEDFGEAFGVLLSGADFGEYHRNVAQLEALQKQTAAHAKEEAEQRQAIKAAYEELLALDEQLIAADAALAESGTVQADAQTRMAALKARELELTKELDTVYIGTNESTKKRLDDTLELAQVKKDIIKTEKELGAEQKKVNEEREAAEDRLQSARDRYNRLVFEGLTADGKLAVLESRRAEKLAEIAALEANGPIQADVLLNAKSDLLELEKEIASANKNIADDQAKANDQAKEGKDISAEQVLKMRELRDVFKDMTDVEFKKFIDDMQNLAMELRKIGGVDLGWITQLAGFKFNGLTSGQARQMARSFSELINGLQGIQIPQGVKDLFAALGALGGGPGKYQVEITVPKGWENGMVLDPMLDTTMKSIDANLKTLAAMKGVIFA